MNHLISFQEAVTLVTNFADHPILGPIANNKALGGTIDRDSFQNQVSHNGFQCGKMAWYCWNEDASAPFHPFFLAFEQYNKYTNNPYPEEPEHGTLQAPRSIFKYTSGQDITNLLKTHQQSLSNPINRDISKTQVKDHVKDFGLDFPNDSANNAFNEEPFGFINSEDPGNGQQSHWEKFISQPGLEAIRYYLGYDETLTVNKIRIVYIGVDINGKNMIPLDVNNALIIDKQFP
jgi:hypothetical protein